MYNPILIVAVIMTGVIALALTETHISQLNQELAIKNQQVLSLRKKVEAERNTDLFAYNIRAKKNIEN